MEITCFSVFLTLLFVSTFYLSNSFTQEGWTQLGLPIGVNLAKIFLSERALLATSDERSRAQLAPTQSTNYNIFL